MFAHDVFHPAQRHYLRGGLCSAQHQATPTVQNTLFIVDTMLSLHAKMICPMYLENSARLITSGRLPIVTKPGRGALFAAGAAPPALSRNPRFIVLADDAAAAAAAVRGATVGTQEGP